MDRRNFIKKMLETTVAASIVPNLVENDDKSVDDFNNASDTETSVLGVDETNISCCVISNEVIYMVNHRQDTIYRINMNTLTCKSIATNI